jgi:hypothetical protein
LSTTRVLATGWSSASTDGQSASDQEHLATQLESHGGGKRPLGADGPTLPAVAKPGHFPHSLRRSHDMAQTESPRQWTHGHAYQIRGRKVQQRERVQRRCPRQDRTRLDGLEGRMVSGRQVRRPFSPGYPRISPASDADSSDGADDRAATRITSKEATGCPDAPAAAQLHDSTGWTRIRSTGMTHVAYDERVYADSEACLKAIREHLETGWMLVQLRGPGTGPFLVVFRSLSCFERMMRGDFNPARRR